MITSCFGPQAFLHRPMISIGTASGSLPTNTVQAVACMPGFSSEAFMIWTGPVLGGLVDELPAGAETAVAANARTAAAIRVVICRSVLRILIVLLRRMSDFGALSQRPAIATFTESTDIRNPTSEIPLSTYL